MWKKETLFHTAGRALRIVPTCAVQLQTNTCALGIHPQRCRVKDRSDLAWEAVLEDSSWCQRPEELCIIDWNLCAMGDASLGVVSAELVFVGILFHNLKFIF